MDKRWIGILIILIVGCCAMYLVVDSSTTVGTAITVVNKTVVTLPSDFSIEDSGNDYAKIINKNTNEKIYIEDLVKKDTALDNYNNQLKKLKQDSGIKILKNSTVNIKNITVYKIDCQNLTTENATNISICYAYTCYHTFLIEFKNYSDNTNLDKNLDYIISNMKADFKQSQD